MKYPVNRKARSSWILAYPSMLDLTQGQLDRFYDKMPGIYHDPELSINHTELGFTHNAIGHPWEGKSEGSSQQTETDNREKKFPSSFILSCSQFQRSKIVKAKSKKINVTAGSEKFTPDKKQSHNVGIEKQNYDTEKVINNLDSKLRLSERVSISRRHEPAKKISSREMEAGISAEVPRNFLRELKAEIGNSWHIFTGETTAHGYKRTTASHRSKLGRFLWVLALVVVTSIVLNIFINSLIRQNLYSLINNVRSEHHHQMAFPAVTVCNLVPYDLSRIEESPLKNGSDRIRQVLLQASSLEDFGISTNHVTQNVFRDMNTRQLDGLIGWTLGNFIQVCKWNDVVVNCSEIFARSLTVADSCFTFNSDPENLKYVDRVGSFSGLSLIVNVGDGMGAAGDGMGAVGDGVGAVSMSVAAGIKVHLHEPREYPNARELGTLVAPGTLTHISVSKLERKMLPKPYEAGGTVSCSDQTNDVADFVDRKISRNHSYSGYSGCVAECRLRAVVHTCSCVVYNFGPKMSTIPFCSMDEYIKCYMPTLRKIYKQLPMHLENCSCPLPCRSVQYIGQVSSASIRSTGHADMRRKNHLELKIYYSELVTTIEEHTFEYKWFDIFANIGGQMSLFTGASILTVLEFLELSCLIVSIILRTTWTRFKRRQKQEHMQC